MRKSEKDRALRKKKKQASMAKKIACKHLRRTAWHPALYSTVDGATRLLCVDCGEVIFMLSNTVSSTAISEEKSKKSIQLKNG